MHLGHQKKKENPDIKIKKETNSPFQKPSLGRLGVKKNDRFDVDFQIAQLLLGASPHNRFNENPSSNGVYLRGDCKISVFALKINTQHAKIKQKMMQ